jgi:hypothetical protein
LGLLLRCTHGTFNEQFIEYSHPFTTGFYIWNTCTIYLQCRNDWILINLTFKTWQLCVRISINCTV